MLHLGTFVHCAAGLPDFFGSTNQSGKKYTELSQNIPKYHKIFWYGRKML
jgi:hypothetical protein